MRQVVFERLGRNHNPEPCPIGDLTDPDDIAGAVWKHARGRLASKDIEVAVLADDTVTVYAGFHIGGTGRIEQVPA